jgi:hypothetical protein
MQANRLALSWSSCRVSLASLSRAAFVDGGVVVIDRQDVHLWRIGRRPVICR